MSDMTAEQLAKKIARWIGANTEMESAYLTPEPHANVEATALLNHIAEETGIAKEVLGAWVEEGQMA